MKRVLSPTSLRASRACRGLTLIELMIAMVLGLVVLLGVIGVISANRQNYRATEALSEIQENARTAFELMARDIRQAADSGCGSDVNFVDLGPGTWWQDWDPVRGFDDATASTAVAFGAGAGRRINDTDALQLQGVELNTTPIISHDPTSSTITTIAGHNLRRNDVVMVCNVNDAEMAVMQNEPAGGITLSIPLTSSSPFERIDNGMVSRYTATTWYVGDNARPADGGRSLYRARLSQGTGAPATVLIEEVLTGVQDMQLRFRGTNAGGQSFAPAAAGTSWADVNAVEIVLTLVSAERNVASDTAINADRRLQRTFTNIVAIRSRVQ